MTHRTKFISPNEMKAIREDLIAVFKIFEGYTVLT